MARFKMNIFYVISAVAVLLLIGYSWLVFLPQFEGTSEYPTVRIMMLFLTVLFLAVLGIQVFLAVKTEKEEQ